MIDQAYRLGDDALANQAELNISVLSLFGVTNPLKFRVQTIEIPEYSVGTYDVHFKTQQFTKPSGKITTPNSFTFSFRSDKYWVIYQALLAWHAYIGSTDTGIMAEDVGAISGESSSRADILVLTFDSNNIPTSPGWKFHKAWPQQIQGFSFDQQSGDPIMVSVTMQFLKMAPNV